MSEIIGVFAIAIGFIVGALFMPRPKRKRKRTIAHEDRGEPIKRNPGSMLYIEDEGGFNSRLRDVHQDYQEQIMDMSQNHNERLRTLAEDHAQEIQDMLS